MTRRKKLQIRFIKKPKARCQAFRMFKNVRGKMKMISYLCAHDLKVEVFQLFISFYNIYTIYTWKIKENAEFSRFKMFFFF